MTDLTSATLPPADPAPLVQYLVVRREAVRSFPLLLAATAQAVVRADRRFRAEPKWAARVAAWRAASFRKVATRANEHDWPKLLAQFEAELGPVSGEEVVAALPPRARSETEPFLRGLQAYTAAVADLPARPVPRSEARPAMLLAINPTISMSAGKTVAQVGHAALLCADAAIEASDGSGWAASADPSERTAWAAAVEDWEAAAMPVLLADVTPAGWERALTELPCAVVADGGLTELAPGTRTVLAVRPSDEGGVREAMAVLGST